jgi:ABC-type uncharacterized transport system permease subunit
MDAILLYALAGILYAALATHLWNTRWRAQQDAALSRWERAAILAPLALHSYLLFSSLFLSADFHFGFGQALSVMMWLAVAIYWVESLFVRLEGMQPLVLGTAGLCAVLPAMFPGMASQAYSHSLEFRLHLILAMLAYSLFTLAALHAFLMTVVEQRLHGGANRSAGARPGSVPPGGPLAGPLSSLPPLLSLESLLFRIVARGFILLTLTLVTGAVFSETLFGKAFQFNHKTLFAVVSWFIFAALLAGRHFYGWRGRTALRWTLTGFVMLLLAYVGSRFVLEVILHRPPAL